MGLTFHQPKEGFEEGDNTDDPGHNAREGTLGQMSQHIGSGQNNRFDVRIQELVSKVQNPGGFLRKKRFLGSIFGLFSCIVAIFAPIFMKFWLQG